MEIVLDLRAVCDVETDRAKERFDSLQRQRQWMEPADVDAAPRQRDVERIGRELRRELRIGQRRPPAGEGGLELRLRFVDLRAGGGPFPGVQLAERFQQIGERARLA